MNITLVEHDPSNPPLRLGDWLAETDAHVTVLRPHAGDALPSSLDGIDGLISLGGEMGAYDDDTAPWLADMRRLLVETVRSNTPYLGICLGAQLLAAAHGGRVERGADGPEIGAYLASKRDLADLDPLFMDVPLSPDVMQYHFDAVTMLPRGAVLLLSSIGYPNQAFRLGPSAWGVQFHVETTAEVIRVWRETDPQLAADEELYARSERRCGPALDEAEQMMTQPWRDFTHRFVELARTGVEPGVFDSQAPRLPIRADGPTLN